MNMQALLQKKIKENTIFSVSAVPNVQYCTYKFIMCVFVPLAKLVKCKTCSGDITFQKAEEGGLGYIYTLFVYAVIKH